MILELSPLLVNLNSLPLEGVDSSGMLLERSF